MYLAIARYQRPYQPAVTCFHLAHTTRLQLTSRVRNQRDRSLCAGIIYVTLFPTPDLTTCFVKDPLVVGLPHFFTCPG
jgi:hypothetical protein